MAEEENLTLLSTLDDINESIKKEKENVKELKAECDKLESELEEAQEAVDEAIAAQEEVDGTQQAIIQEYRALWAQDDEGYLTDFSDTSRTKFHQLTGTQQQARLTKRRKKRRDVGLADRLPPRRQKRPQDTAKPKDTPYQSTGGATETAKLYPQGGSVCGVTSWSIRQIVQKAYKYW